MRKLAGIVLALWVLSSGAALLHFHECCCCEHHDEDAGDEAPCSICLAIHDVPIIALAHAETFEARQDVCAWISPWIAMVPEEVFFDRPLARGPPSLS
jgi:hypothetical protein